MVNPTEYASFNSLQRDRAQGVVNEFAKDLRNISGKCMDIGCGPGDITSDILLPALDPNAVIIDKRLKIFIVCFDLVETMLILFIASHDTFYNIFETMAQDIRFAPYMQSIKEYVSPFNESVRPHEELKDFLKNIGFHVHHCSNREMIVFDSGNFIPSLMSVFAFLDDMPPNQKEEFKIDFAHKYADKKIELYGSKSDDIEDIVLDRQKVLIAYAQKNAS